MLICYEVRVNYCKFGAKLMTAPTTPKELRKLS